ncbi:hypothetical protein SISNIDRAFT_342159 [Sistotremastrum niveocremeum HHB9708]|uniref:DUF6533 domain-containing protein n=1 Tax=Sistotremastrum niveocremeum HHB9708 TaxID=1314777 RepID=A0A164MNK1_9AGAM|nr:hypothetical protein SISNIDRAFT_342159 [Sistotremastrum niveocremeum HHB9708]
MGPRRGLLIANRNNFYSIVSVLTWMIWDIVITLEDEIKYIWQSPPTLPKYLYLYARYITLFAIAAMGPPWNGWLNGSQSSSTYCHQLCVFQIVVPIIVVLGVDLIFILRVHAIYGRNRTCLITLLSLYLLQFASQVVVTSLGEDMIKVDPVLISPQLDYYTCLPRAVPHVFRACWIPVIAFQTLLFGMTLYKSLRTGFDWKFPSRYLFVMVRDGTWAYAVLVGMSIICNLVWSSKTDVASLIVLYPWNIAIMSFAGTRLTLNLRKLNTRPVTSHEVSAIVHSALTKDTSR